MNDSHYEFNLNLLKVFNELYKHQNVQEVANRLGITRTAVSKSLLRLREQLNDPLFVRVGNKFQPTPRAVKIGEKLDNQLNEIFTTCLDLDEFLPLSYEGNIRIALNPMIFESLGSEILLTLKEQLPKTHFHFSNWDSHTTEKLENGEINFGVNVVPVSGDSIHKISTLVTSNKSIREVNVSDTSLVLMMRKNHSLAVKELNNEAIKGSEFAGIILPELNSENALFTQSYETLGVKLTVRSENLNCLFQLLLNSNLVSPILSANIKNMPKGLITKSMKLIKPLPVSTLNICIYYHNRNHNSALYQWLAKEVAAIIEQENI
ncbi:MAG: LysR family transcriptional regulator [Colwellia sp.]